jgi:hypothetical protein
VSLEPVVVAAGAKQAQLVELVELVVVGLVEPMG